MLYIPDIQILFILSILVLLTKVIILLYISFLRILVNTFVTKSINTWNDINSGYSDICQSEGRCRKDYPLCHFCQLSGDKKCKSCGDRLRLPAFHHEMPKGWHQKMQWTGCHTRYGHTKLMTRRWYPSLWESFTMILKLMCYLWTFCAGRHRYTVLWQGLSGYLRYTSTDKGKRTQRHTAYGKSESQA